MFLLEHEIVDFTELKELASKISSLRLKSAGISIIFTPTSTSVPLGLKYQSDLYYIRHQTRNEQVVGGLLGLLLVV